MSAARICVEQDSQVTARCGITVTSRQCTMCTGPVYLDFDYCCESKVDWQYLGGRSGPPR